jgi:hypothetical protein
LAKIPTGKREIIARHIWFLYPCKATVRKAKHMRLPLVAQHIAFALLIVNPINQLIVDHDSMVKKLLQPCYLRISGDNI